MNLFGVWVWMCACVWVTELGPTRTCTGRAGTQHRMSLACVTWSYFLSLDFCRDFVLLVNQFLYHFFCTFCESFSYVYIFLAWNWLLHLNLSLAPGGNCSWWCGGWACCGLGAFAFFCPLSLHCIFLHSGSAPWSCLSTSACILLLVAGEWAWIHFCFTTCKQTVACWVSGVSGGFYIFFCSVLLFLGVSVCVHIFILAWLIRMPLAGSCPNRGCHLIKSIICWLNLLELRRKRSVPTLSHPLLSFRPSLTHSFVHPYSEMEKTSHRNPRLIRADH